MGEAGPDLGGFKSYKRFCVHSFTMYEASIVLQSKGQLSSNNLKKKIVNIDHVSADKENDQVHI